MPTIQKIVTAVRNMGIANSIALKAAEVRMKLAPKDRLIPLRAPGVPTLFCRAGTSDRNVFNQIFVEREHRQYVPIRRLQKAYSRVYDGLRPVPRDDE